MLRAKITVTSADEATVVVDEAEPESIQGHQVQARILGYLSAVAARQRTTILATDGEWTFRVGAQGVLSDDEPDDDEDEPDEDEPEAPAQPAGESTPPSGPTPRPEPPRAFTRPPAATPRQRQTTAAPSQVSFLPDQRAQEMPATEGWRGRAARLGLSVAPSARELSERHDRRAISRYWSGPRMVAVVNPKGGSMKTPTTILLSSLFAQASGAGVIAWDNNQTRGTLGWRTASGFHEATVGDLLTRIDAFEAPGSRVADLAAVVHHQPDEHYDVLRSNPTVTANLQRITPADFDRIAILLGRTYRLVIVDSGNDESDPVWRQMVSRTNVLVVPTTTRPEHAEAARLMLTGLAEAGGVYAELARTATVIVSQASPAEPPTGGVAAQMAAIVQGVAEIPYDPAMGEIHLKLSRLAPATRRAWLRAAAEVAHSIDTRTSA